MKLTSKTILILLVLAVVTAAFAQTNRERRRSRDRGSYSSGGSSSSDRVPGPTAYEAFSGFISERNIFDPNRQPHYSGAPRPVTKVRADAPFLSLVGIMSYNKGLFAFFNGNDEDLKQVLAVSGKIDHYTVAELTTSSVKLVSNDQKETLDLRVGDVLRQIDGQWKLTGGDMPEETTAASAAGDDNATSTDTSASVPGSADQPNAILKRLMELREKENQ